jgi:septum formation protein
VGVPFTVVPAGVEEVMTGEPEAVAAENARRKALAGDHGDALVLGADTIVAVDGDVLGKPRDAAEAVAYIARLAGRSHEVVGGIALARGGAVVAEAVEITAVAFRGLASADVEAYVGLGEWEGRAGGYAIQGAGAALVRTVAGDYLNVVGLPLARLLDLLPERGLQALWAR